jgi:hypothetical protein
MPKEGTMTTYQEETRDQMILRLAARARESGVRIVRELHENRYYASSASMPGYFHYVTGISCDCKGFSAHQKCMHWAALLVALGWVAEEPEPDPTSPAPLIRCETCNGAGEIHGTVSTGPTSWVYSSLTCHDCHGRGQFACPACVDTGIVEAYGDFCRQTRTPCSCPHGQALTVVDLTIVKRSRDMLIEQDAA